MEYLVEIVTNGLHNDKYLGTMVNTTAFGVMATNFPTIILKITPQGLTFSWIYDKFAPERQRRRHAPRKAA